MYLILSLLLSVIFPKTVIAQEATPTKTPNKEVLEMVQQKVKTMLQQNTTESTTTPKSQLGTITQIDPTQATITYKNENKVITLTDKTVFIDIKKNKIKVDSLKAGQDILALGYLNQYGNFEAKRVVITNIKSIENKNEIIIGKIADISQSSVFVLIPIKNKETQYQIKTDSKTEIIDKDNNKTSFDKLKSGQKIIVIIQPDAKIAKTFYVSKIITLETPTAQVPETPTAN